MALVIQSLLIDKYIGSLSILHQLSDLSMIICCCNQDHYLHIGINKISERFLPLIPLACEQLRCPCSPWGIKPGDSLLEDWQHSVGQLEAIGHDGPSINRRNLIKQFLHLGTPQLEVSIQTTLIRSHWKECTTWINHWCSLDYNRVCLKIKEILKTI